MRIERMLGIGLDLVAADVAEVLGARHPAHIGAVRPRRALEVRAASDSTTPATRPTSTPKPSVTRIVTATAAKSASE